MTPLGALYPDYAVMLAYIRDSDKSWIMADIVDEWLKIALDELNKTLGSSFYLVESS